MLHRAVKNGIHVIKLPKTINVSENKKN